MPVPRTPSKLRGGCEQNSATIDHTRRMSEPSIGNDQEPVNNPNDERVNQSNNDNEEVELLKEQLAMMQVRLEALQRAKIERTAHSQPESINRTRNTEVPGKNITNSPQSESSLIQCSATNDNVANTQKRTTPSACKPEVFNGEAKENASLWVNSMLRFLKLTETPKNLWVSTAASYLKSNALLWWDAYLNSSTTEESEISFEEFKTLFLQRYQLVNATQSAHTRLVKWKQIGSIDTYINGFLNLSSQVPYTVVGELGRVDYFLEGLKPHIRRFVQAARPQNIQQAIVFARENAETFQSNSSSGASNTGFQRGRSAFSQKAMPDIGNMDLDNAEIADTEGEASLLHGLEGEQLTYASPSPQLHLAQLTEEQKHLYRTGCCFYCKSKGHTQRECVKRKQDLNKRFANRLK